MTRRLTMAALIVAASTTITRAAGAEQGPATPAPGTGPFARIAVLHPRDGHTVDFESGYLRHLGWHQQVGDTWTWYGWTVTFGERQRWFVYASFGHSAAGFDATVPAAEDERDNVLNVAPHVDAWRNALYEFLPALSRGTGTPQPTARLELLTVDLLPGDVTAFEAALAERRASLRDETLWYRLVAGGRTPRYVRLRPQPNFAAILDSRNDQVLPDTVRGLIATSTVEILTLRPTLSLNLDPSARK